ncbi:MAG: hypothetical protein WC419_06960 [Candidatus Omnitrophota bacterium]|jgi:hypothetical protein|nr:hypothetical protein [Candidatus Omnitrophota bacterium]
MKKLLAALLLVGLCGCSATQLRQEFFGYSMNDVKNSKTKQVRDFDMNASDCIANIKVILKDMGAIAREDKRNQYIVADNFQGVFRSSIDTTQVGILITSISENKCRVEIASGNIDLAAFVAKEITIKDRSEKGVVLKE